MVYYTGVFGSLFDVTQLINYGLTQDLLSWYKVFLPLDQLVLKIKACV